MLVIQIAVFLAGLILTLLALLSALRTLVLSRGVQDVITAFVFINLRRVFNLRLRWASSYADRDRIMVYYAPIGLLCLPPTWLSLVLFGFMGMFWASGIPTWSEAFIISGSSLLTLGFARGDSLLQITLAFSEATIGLILVALLIAYLPTMYSAFAKRETAVNLLEARAGQPPSAVMMILRYQRNHGLDRLRESWEAWETWFAEVQESHTALAALVFFRSAQPKHSWVTAAGAVLDAAALSLSVLDIPWDAQAALCIRSGYIALRSISDFFNIPYNPKPHYPADGISISRQEFDQAIVLLAKANVPLVADLERAWIDFAGWRVNYDGPLIALARLTMAPEAPWSAGHRDE